jgi:hypothetical protein
LRKGVGIRVSVSFYPINVLVRWETLGVDVYGYSFISLNPGVAPLTHAGWIWRVLSVWRVGKGALGFLDGNFPVRLLSVWCWRTPWGLILG